MDEKTLHVKFDWGKWFVPALVLFCFALYWKSMHYGFSPADENWLIVGEEANLSRWHHLSEAFRFRIQNIYYRPLLIWSFLLNYKMSGLAPTGYHVANVLFHVMATLLLFTLLKKFGLQDPAAFLISLLFAADPIHLHAVAWVPGRNDSILCIFVLISIITLHAYFQSGRIVLFSLHLLALLGALFTKESAFPIVAVYGTLAILRKPRAKQIALCMVCWTAALFLWYSVRRSTFPVEPPIASLSVAGIPKFIWALLSATGKTLIPLNQSVAPVADRSTVIAGALVFAAIALTFRTAIRRNMELAVTGLTLFFFMSLFPVWFGSQAILGELYEHRQYVPAAGLFIFLASAIPARMPVWLKPALFAVAGVYATLTLSRMKVYRTYDGFLNQALQSTPRNYFLHVQFAQLLMDEGRLNEAEEHLTIAAEIQPKKPYIHEMRGDLYNALGRKELAQAEYRLALGGIL